MVKSKIECALSKGVGSSREKCFLFQVTGLVTASGREIREQYCQAIMEYECKFFVYG